MQQQRRELGSVVVKLLKAGRLTSDERLWLAVDERTDGDLHEGLLLLTWLHLISTCAR